MVPRAVAAIAQVGPAASVNGQTLVIRARGVVEMLPSLLGALQTTGLGTGEVRLRENTLEDAFIALTGRRLRE